MPINSRDKGARMEREAAGEWENHTGISARRAQQFCGKAGTADLKVEGGVPLHLEVKGIKRIAACRYMDQAVRDAAEGNIPVVLMRENKGEWMVMVHLKNLTELANVLWSRS